MHRALCEKLKAVKLRNGEIVTREESEMKVFRQKRESFVLIKLTDGTGDVPNVTHWLSTCSTLLGEL